MKKDYLELKFYFTLKVLDLEVQRQIRKKTIREVFNFISTKKELIKNRDNVPKYI